MLPSTKNDETKPKKQLKLNVDEVKVSDLKFMKVCSKCGEVSYQEKDVVKCGGWYENSIIKGSCVYWIHKDKNCCKTDTNVNYCPSCYKLLQSNVADNISLSESNINHRSYQSDDDQISYSRTIRSESFQTVNDSLKKNKNSAECSLPSTIDIGNVTDNKITDDIEDNIVEMHSDIEQVDTSSSMVPYKEQVAIVEQNDRLQKELIIDRNVLVYVLSSIDLLENSFPSFIDFESYMCTIEMQNNYVKNYSGDDTNFPELISNLFQDDQNS